MVDSGNIDVLYKEFLDQGCPDSILKQLSLSNILEGTLLPAIRAFASDAYQLLALRLIQYNPRQYLLRQLYGSFPDQMAVLATKAISCSSSQKMSYKLRTVCLVLLQRIFELSDVQKAVQSCEDVFSILIWKHMDERNRKQRFRTYPILRKRYKLQKKAFDDANDDRLTSVNFVYDLVMELFSLLNTQKVDQEVYSFCVAIIDTFNALLEQKNTRRYVATLLDDLYFLPIIQALPTVKLDLAGSLVASIQRARYLIEMPLDEGTGRSLSGTEWRQYRSQMITELQIHAYKDSRGVLSFLGLSNHSSIHSPVELLAHLSDSAAEDIHKLCLALHLRATFEDPRAPELTTPILLSCLVARYRSILHPCDFVLRQSLHPTEQSLHTLGSAANICSRPQYFSSADLLHDVIASLRRTKLTDLLTELQQTIERIRPECLSDQHELVLRGQSIKVLKLTKLAILEVIAPNLTAAGVPALVRAELEVETQTITAAARSSWNSLRKNDVVYLVRLTQETSNPSNITIRTLRSATILDITPFSDTDISHKFSVGLDRTAYQADCKEEDIDGLYSSLNILVKRSADREGFYQQIDYLQSAMRDWESLLPSFLLGSFLGVESVFADTLHSEFGLNDTFLDSDHVFESALKLQDQRSVPLIGRISCSLKSIQLSRDNGEECIKSVDIQLVPRHSRIRHEDSSRIRYSRRQIEAILICMAHNVSVLDGMPGTGKFTVLGQIVSNLYNNNAGRIIIVSENDAALVRLVDSLGSFDIAGRHLFHLQSDGSTQSDQVGSLAWFANRLEVRLLDVKNIATSLGLSADHGSSCESALYFWLAHLKDMVAACDIARPTSVPGYEYLKGVIEPDSASSSHGAVYIDYLQTLFDELADLRPLELMYAAEEQLKHILQQMARVIVLTPESARKHQGNLFPDGLSAGTLIVLTASSMTDTDMLTSFAALSSAAELQRCIFVGNHEHANKQRRSTDAAHSAQGVAFLRMIRAGVPRVTLRQQFRSRPEIVKCFEAAFLPQVYTSTEHASTFDFTNAGFRYAAQLIDTQPYNGQEEVKVRAEYQNLGEAEHIVALFQYMRLLDYPAASITILTTSNSQKALIQEILDARCQGNGLYGLPLLASVSGYVGQQNDYILVSLVRSSPCDELEDLGILQSAFSRARLGLYVFGKRSAIYSSHLSQTFKSLDVEESGKLILTVGEMYPSKRSLKAAADIKTVAMEDVTHLGQYVFEMAAKKTAHMSKSSKE